MPQTFPSCQAPTMKHIQRVSPSHRCEAKLLQLQHSASDRPWLWQGCLAVFPVCCTKANPCSTPPVPPWKTNIIMAGQGKSLSNTWSLLVQARTLKCCFINTRKAFLIYNQVFRLFFVTVKCCCGFNTVRIR